MKRPPTQQPSADVSDPLSADGSSPDPVARWAEELRHAVVADIEPSQVHLVAELAASASVASAVSLPTAGSAAAGSMTGVQSMTSFLATTAGKLVTSATVALAIGTSTAAVAGVLPGPLQDGAADLVGAIGIELPHSTQTIDVDGVGQIDVTVVDGILELIGIDAGAGWDAQLVSQTDTRAVVEFVSDSATSTVTVATDAAGDVTSVVETKLAAQGGGRGGATVGEGSIDADSGAAVDGSMGTDLDVPGIDSSVSTDVEVEVDAGLGLRIGE